MPYRDVLVHMKFYEDWSEHIEVAGRVSRVFEARLTGLCTLRDVGTLKAASRGAGSLTVSEQRAKDTAAAQKAEGLFHSSLKRTGIEGRWMIGEGEASELLTWASRFHDLVIVEQTDNVADGVDFDVAEECALASGRPTLVVPFKGQFPTVGRRILVAWNDSREAALAVYGALPFFEKSEKVDVLLGRAQEGFHSITRYPDLKITDYLRRHAATVEEHCFDPPDTEVGAAILDEAQRVGSDLIVMGAYGRSWFSELILGGATRDVLSKMHVPVLMAH